MTEIGPVPPRHPELGPCLLWKGYTSKKNPYGYIQVDGRLEGVHRPAYRTFVMEIPDRCDVSHLCDIPNCVNAVGGHLVVEPSWLNTGRIPALALRRARRAILTQKAPTTAASATRQRLE